MKLGIHDFETKVSGESLEDAMYEESQRCYEKIRKLQEMEEILDVLRETKLWKYPKRAGFTRCLDGLISLYIDIWGVPYEIIVDFWCSALRKAFGATFEMQPTADDGVNLKTRINGFDVVIMCFGVGVEEATGCKVVPKKRMVEITDYVIDCPGAKEAA